MVFVHAPHDRTQVSLLKQLRVRGKYLFKMYSISLSKKENDINQQQKVVQQLRRECKIDRVKVSQCANQ